MTTAQDKIAADQAVILDQVSSAPVWKDLSATYRRTADLALTGTPSALPIGVASDAKLEEIRLLLHREQTIQPWINSFIPTCESESK
jgi:hypothetical protein